MIGEDNFLLFTPMLPQVASGMIETRHIVFPIRTICKKTKFYEGRIKNIDPYGKLVTIWGTRDKRSISIHYDFLVVALGSETNFFGMADVEKNAYTMKTLNDAVMLRNRVIDMLEQAENETNPILRKSFLNFVVVGGGFAGIETAGVTPVNTIKRSMFKTEKGKLIVNDFLEVTNFPGVFAIGDCALFVDPITNRPFPPTAQIAEAQAKTAAKNLISLIQNSQKEKFVYHSKGQMAIIGKRSGIATFLGVNISGFLAWLIWRNVYLSKIPTFDKKIRVLLDWIIDLFFDRDISRLKLMKRETEKEYKLLDEVDDVW